MGRTSRRRGISDASTSRRSSANGPSQSCAINRGRTASPPTSSCRGRAWPSEYLARYAAEVRYFDDELARLLTTVAEVEGESGTVVLLTADHGESHGEGGYWFAHGHATTPDLARVPFVVRAPGVAPGRSGVLAHHVDVLPTLLDLVGFPVPGDARGVSLASGAPPADRVLFCELEGEVTAYRGDVFVRRVAGEPRTFTWGSERWRSAPDDAALTGAIGEHLAIEPDPRPADALSDEDQQRLEALGYVDPLGDGHDR